MSAETPNQSLRDAATLMRIYNDPAVFPEPTLEQSTLLYLADLLEAHANRADEIMDTMPESSATRRAVVAGNLAGYREALAVAAAYLDRVPQPDPPERL